MGDQGWIRKTVGKRRETRSVFERIRDLNRSLKELGIERKDDGELIRKVVGRPRK
jgi:hypothetical protein